MNRSFSLSSIPSVSSESLHIHSSDSAIISHKEQSFKECLNEFNEISKGLNEKVESLRRWEKELEFKEQKITSLCSSVKKYIEVEVSSKYKDIINNAGERYFDLERKYNSLTKELKRVQSSFDVMKTQNKYLKIKLQDQSVKEEALRKDNERLVTRNAGKRVSSGFMEPSIKSQSLGTQTSARIEKRVQNGDNRLEVKFSTIFYELWLQLFEMYTKNMVVNVLQSGDVDGHPRDTFADVCLQVIPPCVEYIRDCLSGPEVDCRAINDLRSRQYIEVLHWSVVYLDVHRIPLRQGLLSPLTRLSEDLALILVPKRGSSPSSKKGFVTDNELLSLIILLVTRHVNQPDILSLVLQQIIEEVQNDASICGLLLARYMYASLLCRWTAASALNSSLHLKILTLLLGSFSKKIDSPPLRCSVHNLVSVSCKASPLVTGLDTLILLLSTSPLSISTSRGPTSAHPLMFLVDIFHSFDHGQREAIMLIFEHILKSKTVRDVGKELGLVGVVTGLLSRQASATDPSDCRQRLRSLLDQLT